LQVIFIGMLASLFFASTFVINRAMDLSGGSWIYATDKAENNPKKLAAVEATQSGEVVFTVFGEVMFLKGEIPAGGSLIGIIIIIIGMVLHSMNLAKK
jgi:uncharacterized membrane protein